MAARVHVWCHQMNSCVSCVHLSRVKESLVSMSAIFLGRVSIFDLQSRIQDYPVEQIIQVHAMGSGDMSHGRAPAFYDYLDLCNIIFKNKERRSLAGDVRLSKKHSQYFLLTSCHERLRLSGLVLRMGSLPVRGSNTSVTMSTKLSARIPSNLRLASNEIISFGAAV